MLEIGANQVAVGVVAPVGGKARWVVVPTLDKTRAVRRKAQAERELARAKGERITPPERCTLGEAVEALIATARVSDMTRSLYRHDLDRRELQPLLRRRIADVTIDDIARLVGRA